MPAARLSIIGPCLIGALLAFSLPSYAGGNRAIHVSGTGTRGGQAPKVKASIMTIMPDCGDPSCQCPWGQVVNNLQYYTFYVDDPHRTKTFCAYIRGYGTNAGSNIRIFPHTEVIYFDCVNRSPFTSECNEYPATSTHY